MFGDDGRFHPLSANFLGGGAFNCGTQDARGDAFLNERDIALPASGLTGAEADVSGGCYGGRRRPSACPRRDLRDVYYGLLGPDAVSVTYTTRTGALRTSATAGGDGAYLIVLAHARTPCPARQRDCPGAGAGSFGPTESDLRAGQRVRFAEFFDRRCPGVYRVKVGFVDTDGPAGAMPVPGLPGQSAEVPVGAVDFTVP